MASTLSLVWVGDLDQEKHKSIKYTSFPPERFQPKRIEMKPSKREIKIGRVNSKFPPDFIIESCINNRMISRNHATIERTSKGSGFMLYDHSLNGTYINYKRVLGGISLTKGDIVCFGHINGANLKPGEEVSPFYSDLKYKVDIVSGGKRKQADSPHSAASSKQSESEDGDDDVSVSSSNASNRKKSMKKRPKIGESGDIEPRKSLKPRKSIVAKTPSNKPKVSNKKRREDGDGTGDLFHYETEKCSAKTCKQPQDAAVDWIQCDRCTKWYHQLCIGCKPQEAESDTYYCPYCK